MREEKEERIHELNVKKSCLLALISSARKTVQNKMNQSREGQKGCF